jgi:hypothetical protein
MELLEVVARHHPDRAVLPDVAVDPGGDLVGGQRRRRVEGHLQGDLVDRLELGQLTGAGAGVVGRRLRHLPFEDELLPPPDDVLGRPRLAVGPLESLAEVEGPLRRVVVGLPRLDQTGADVLTVVEVAQQRVPVEELPVRVRVARAGGPEDVHVEPTAVVARLDPAVRDDVRILRQPLLDRRQVLPLQ